MAMTDFKHHGGNFGVNMAKMAAIYVAVQKDRLPNRIDR
jgi:hypothetical protein